MCGVGCRKRSTETENILLLCSTPTVVIDFCGNWLPRTLGTNRVRSTLWLLANYEVESNAKNVLLPSLIDSNEIDQEIGNEFSRLKLELELEYWFMVAYQVTVITETAEWSCCRSVEIGNGQIICGLRYRSLRLNNRSLDVKDSRLTIVTILYNIITRYKLVDTPFLVWWMAYWEISIWQTSPAVACLGRNNIYWGASLQSVI